MMTQGPWRVEYETRIEYGPILAGEGFAVAKVLRDPPEWKANARAIAQVPAMVEMILVPLGSRPCERQAKHTTRIDGPDCGTCLACKARAIIKALEGEK